MADCSESAPFLPVSIDAQYHWPILR